VTKACVVGRFPQAWQQRAVAGLSVPQRPHVAVAVAVVVIP
jgi:hypothetical protein